MRTIAVCLAFLATLVPGPPALAEEPEISEASQSCLECHAEATPAIVADWKRSAHAVTSPLAAQKKPEAERKVSSTKKRPEINDKVVGCAECHTLHPKMHKDTVEHDEFQMHPVVSPADCAVCHPTEVQEYNSNLMSRAYPNLRLNPLYMDLANEINGPRRYENGKLIKDKPNLATEAESCFYCHGTKIEVTGTKTRETDWGEITTPVLKGWPSHGVGRINPDGQWGSCTACHPRHSFSLAVARNPATCSECHKGPDVPAYQAYSVSKHGNIHAALAKDWNMTAVPWTVGRDFTAPTCATCHISALQDTEGKEIVKRTHEMADRIDTRLMGLVYAAPHPKLPTTYSIRNKDNQPLATALDGTPAAKFLIDKKEQAKRRATMKKVCQSCHSKTWVDGQFARLDNTIKVSNQQTLAATRMIQEAWAKGLAKGPDRNDSPFNEPLEKDWIRAWLFHANAARYASAMLGADYGVFALGRWEMARILDEMEEKIKGFRK